jgi:hypothetical protein
MRDYIVASQPPVGTIRLRWIWIAFLALFVAPIAASAAVYAWRGASVDWRAADRSSAGLLRPASETPGAVVRVFSARTVSWRGVFATHSWIVMKPAGASAYRRYDYTAWGEPIWVDRFVADGRWFGQIPQVVFAADGEAAEAIIPKIEAAVASYAFRHQGDYHVWPGPNSNTFVASVMSAAPEINAVLPPTAIGKDFPIGSWFGRTPSGTGLQINFGGYVGLTIGWIEGVEFNLLGAVVGFDLRRPALKLPSIGRVGV